MVSLNRNLRGCPSFIYLKTHPTFILNYVHISITYNKLQTGKLLVIRYVKVLIVGVTGVTVVGGGTNCQRLLLLLIHEELLPLNVRFMDKMAVCRHLGLLLDGVEDGLLLRRLPRWPSSKSVGGASEGNIFEASSSHVVLYPGKLNPRWLPTFICMAA